MRFRFCGNGDCPDWVLAEINTLSRLSSIKLKLLGQIVAQGLITPPIDANKAEKLFVESKLDPDVDLKSCIACLTYIIFSTTRYNCDHGALLSELQQLGLPREHSMSVKKVADDHSTQLAAKLKATSLRVNALEDLSAHVDPVTKNAVLEVTVDGKNQSVVISSLTVRALLTDLKFVKRTMLELINSPYS